MARAILADMNVEGHLQALVTVLESSTWRELWASVALPMVNFNDLGLTATAPDALVWQVCQEQQILLVTANRNDDGPDSLEATIRARNTADSLPVFTLSKALQVFHSRAYMERVAERFLDCLMNLDRYRGAGRVYLP